MLDFTTPPTEAIAYLLSKKPHVLKDKATFKHHLSQKAFTISGITNIDRLSAFQHSLALAMLKGQSFSEWKKANTSLIEGWEGADNKRLKKIYAHNLKNAYAQGRKMEMMSRPALSNEGEEDGWYIRFSCVLDRATRPSHRALHGTILPRKHSFWKTHTPPLDWGCRCKIDIFSQDDLERKGWTPSSTPPISSIDNPFAFGSPNEELAHIIHKKLEAHKHNKNATQALQAMQEELERREKCFSNIRRLWDSEDLKTPYSICSIPSALSSILGTQAKEVKIVADTIRRHKTRHPEIDAFDYSLIPYMLENFQSIYQDDKRGVKYLLISRFGRFYRLSLKSLKDKDEVWVESLSSASDDKSLKNNLKNKRLVYEQDARKL